MGLKYKGVRSSVDYFGADNNRQHIHSINVFGPSDRYVEVLLGRLFLWVVYSRRMGRIKFPFIRELLADLINVETRLI